MKVRSSKSLPIEALKDIVERIAQGYGSSKFNVGNLVVKRDGLYCSIAPNSKTWIPVQRADEISQELFTALLRGHRRVDIEVLVKLLRDRSEVKLSTAADTKRWLQKNFPKTEETMKDGWTWRIRVKVSD